MISAGKRMDDALVLVLAMAFALALVLAPNTVGP